MLETQILLRIQEDYITRFSEEIEGRVTNKLSEEFRKSHFGLALSQLDEFLQNPQSQARSGLVAETCHSLSRENQGTKEDGSQNDPHPDVGVSLSHSSQNVSPEETSYINPL